MEGGRAGGRAGGRTGERAGGFWIGIFFLYGVIFSEHIFEPEKVRASNVAEDAVLNEGRVDEVLHFPVLLRKERPVHPRPNVVRGVVPIVEEEKVEYSSREIAAVVVLACRIASVVLQHVQRQDAHFSGQGWEDVHGQGSPPSHPG